jgi:hypothetical protein
MVNHRFPVIVTLWLTVTGVSINAQMQPSFSQIASNSSTILLAQASPTGKITLIIGSQGDRVRLLQNNLKELGYFTGAINGVFDENTRQAVIKFQTEKGLQVNGIATVALQEVVEGIIFDQHMNDGYAAAEVKDYEAAKAEFTQALKIRPNNLYATRALNNVEQYITRLEKQERIKAEREQKLRENLWIIIILSAIALSLLATIILKFKKSKNNSKESAQLPVKNNSNNGQETINIVKESEISIDSTTPIINNQEKLNSNNNSLLVTQETASLNKVDGVEELIKDLKLSQGASRRKAIWELAQRADSRAMQPLVQLMLDADSQERSLILEAISQISTRTLKPLNRALALSLQDENSQVRLNAIRDLTRIYELIAEVNQRLYHATDDEDPEVRETASWALKNLSKMQLPYSKEEEKN